MCSKCGRRPCTIRITVNLADQDNFPKTTRYGQEYVMWTLPQIIEFKYTKQGPLLTWFGVKKLKYPVQNPDHNCIEIFWD